MEGREKGRIKRRIEKESFLWSSRSCSEFTSSIIWAFIIFYSIIHSFTHVPSLSFSFSSSFFFHNDVHQWIENLNVQKGRRFECLLYKCNVKRGGSWNLWSRTEEKRRGRWLRRERKEQKREEERVDRQKEMGWERRTMMVMGRMMGRMDRADSRVLFYSMLGSLVLWYTLPSFLPSYPSFWSPVSGTLWSLVSLEQGKKVPIEWSLVLSSPQVLPQNLCKQNFSHNAEAFMNFRSSHPAHL